MSNLKNQLIKLGSQYPDLQKHLRPVLDCVVAGKEDIPNYRKSRGNQKCGNCGAFEDGYCHMFDTKVQSEYTCDDWVPAGEYKKGSRSKKALSKDLNDFIRGNKIFDLKERLADIGMNILNNEGLSPRQGATIIDGNSVKIVIVCQPGKEFPNDPDEEKLNGIINRITKNIGRLGYRVQGKILQNQDGMITISIIQKF